MDLARPAPRGRGRTARRRGAARRAAMPRPWSSTVIRTSPRPPPRPRTASQRPSPPYLSAFSTRFRSARRRTPASPRTAGRPAGTSCAHREPALLAGRPRTAPGPASKSRATSTGVPLERPAPGDRHRRTAGPARPSPPAAGPRRAARRRSGAPARGSVTTPSARFSAGSRSRPPACAARGRPRPRTPSAARASRARPLRGRPPPGPRWRPGGAGCRS